jgi:hypothetical protein
MIVLDISITITALPKIHTTLGFSNTALSWVQNAYLLAFGGLLLLGTRASDLVAARRGTGQYEGGAVSHSDGWDASIEGASRTLESASVPMTIPRRFISGGRAVLPPLWTISESRLGPCWPLSHRGKRSSAAPEATLRWFRATRWRDGRPRGRPPQAAARRVGLEFVEKRLPAKLTSTDTTERNVMLRVPPRRIGRAGY